MNSDYQLEDVQTKCWLVKGKLERKRELARMDRREGEDKFYQTEHKMGTKEYLAF